MHLMIDLETLGLDLNCVVTQIGYVAFDEMGIHFSGHLRPNLAEQSKMGRSISTDTFIWWLQQGDEARRSMGKEQDQLMYDCLLEFTQDIEMQFGWANIEGIWSHGMNFDLAIMENLFKNYAIKCPWAKIFRNLRDTRTLFALIPNFIWPAQAGIKHDANSDAFAQAEAVRYAWRCLKLVGE